MIAHDLVTPREQPEAHQHNTHVPVSTAGGVCHLTKAHYFFAGTTAVPGTVDKPKEPLSSWFSFEDPGQSSATPISTPVPQVTVSDVLA